MDVAPEVHDGGAGPTGSRGGGQQWACSAAKAPEQGAARQRGRVVRVPGPTCEQCEWRLRDPFQPGDRWP